MKLLSARRSLRAIRAAQHPGDGRRGIPELAEQAQGVSFRKGDLAVRRSELRTLILDRDRDKTASFPNSTKDYLDLIRGIRREDPKKAPRPSTFTEAIQFFDGDLHRLLQALSIEPISEPEAAWLWSSIDQLRTHKAQVFVWLYLCFICLRDKTVPSHDRLDELHHVAEASYCRAFMTNDHELANTLATLNLGLRPILLDDLLATALPAGAA
jgi:hypothetical protein